mmetsp:Transcript_8026/g.18928  ORF Transcript_8026/g.18928 Transcript_8026/m.18928 type:complete len:568 (+) Transcript_8026:286-1989(+)
MPSKSNTPDSTTSPGPRFPDEEEERDIEQEVGCCHPTRNTYRYFALFLICMLTFGQYYCYDIPGALKSIFFQHFTGLTQLQYNLLYSLYSWPNTVLVFFGGYFIDKYLGVRWGCFICCSTLVLGQALVSVGTKWHSLYVVLFGRFVFGLGGETLTVAQSTYTAQWFKGAELSTAFGVCLSFSRLGSAVNFDLSPLFVDHFGGAGNGGFSAAMYMGTVACLISLLCTIVLNFMDYRAERMRARSAMSKSQSEANLEEQPVRLSDVATFPVSVWLIFLITIAFYSSVFVFLQNGVQFLEQQYGYQEKQAALYMSLPYTVSAAACPIFGYLVDKTGRAILWILLAMSMLCYIHYSFAWIPDFPPMWGVVGMGLAYSICAAALWPCIAIVVDMHMLGMAYGLMTALMNLGLAVCPIVISPLLPDADSKATPAEFAEMYRDVMNTFGGMAAFAIVVTLLLWAVDLRAGGWLNASAAMLQEHEIAVAKEEARRQQLIDSTPMAYRTHTHQRNKYLTRLGIRQHHQPRLAPEYGPEGPEWLQPRFRHPDVDVHFPEEREGLVLGRHGADDDEDA